MRGWTGYFRTNFPCRLPPAPPPMKMGLRSCPKKVLRQAQHEPDFYKIVRPRIKHGAGSELVEGQCSGRIPASRPHRGVGTGFPRYDEVCGKTMRGWPGYFLRNFPWRLPSAPPLMKVGPRSESGKTRRGLSASTAPTPAPWVPVSPVRRGWWPACFLRNHPCRLRPAPQGMKMGFGRMRAVRFQPLPHPIPTGAHIPTPLRRAVVSGVIFAAMGGTGTLPLPIGLAGILVV